MCFSRRLKHIHKPHKKHERLSRLLGMETFTSGVNHTTQKWTVEQSRLNLETIDRFLPMRVNLLHLKEDIL